MITIHNLTSLTPRPWVRTGNESVRDKSVENDHCARSGERQRWSAVFIEHVACFYGYLTFQTSEQREDEIYRKYLGIFMRPFSHQDVSSLFNGIGGQSSTSI